MRIAVTGAAGFIGRHVLHALAQQRIETVAVVIPTAPEPSLSCTRTVRLDIRDARADAFDLLGRPDGLVHLAWGGLPNYRSPHHFEEELPMQYQFLKGMVTSGLRNLLVTGTCSEYGMQYGPLSEDLEARPNHSYGFAKDVLRRQLEHLKTTRCFNLVWARLFYLYGDGQPEHALFPQLRRAVERGDTVFDMSGGEQLRDYLPVDTVAKYLVALTLKQSDTGPINVCSGQPVSVRSLVENWINTNEWGISLNLGAYPYPDYEPMAFWGDGRKLKHIMGGQ